MKKLISDTEEIAFNYLKAFNFKDEQIKQLIIQGKKDLSKELMKLKTVLQDDELSYDNINNILHALKGLLFQLGNHEAAERLTEIRSHLDNEETLKELTLLCR